MTHAKLKELIQEAQWAAYDVNGGEAICPWCGASQAWQAHDEDCRAAELMGWPMLGRPTKRPR